jgi:mRNA-degrading endonuclease RelE of RelBE toxin-antitoxin system
MTYELEFSDKAWKEWQKLGATLRAQFKKKLEERLENPHVRRTVYTDWALPIRSSCVMQGTDWSTAW